MLSVSCISKSAGTKCLKMYPAYWLTHTIATPIAFLITAIFWCAVYEPELTPFDAHNYFVHANNSFMMFVDLLMVAHPTNMAHVIYPIIFGIIYSLFSIFYYLAGGVTREGEPYIYKILDWREPARTVLMCVGALSVLVVIYVLVYLLSKYRKKLHDKYFIQEQDVE
nr:unnamed protein product [Callosobruchus chinensis]